MGIQILWQLIIGFSASVTLLITEKTDWTYASYFFFPNTFNKSRLCAEKKKKK